jgi:methylmalonyl-CoA epimerase
MHLDHLAIAVPDIEPALEFFRDALGLTVERIEDVPAEGVRVAFLPLGGSHVELVQPTRDETGIARWMAKHAQGMHHLCIETPEIDALLARLVARGVELINVAPVVKPDGTRYAFVHPRSASGVLVELYQRPTPPPARDADCVFCRILDGALPGSVVYRDAACTALMDIQPVNPGHVLVIPNAHAPDLAALDPATGAHLFEIGRRIALALPRSGVRCEGVNFFLANGEAAGQEVSHVHLHVFPRFEGDGFRLKHGPDYNRKPAREALDVVAEGLRRGLNR